MNPFLSIPAGLVLTDILETVWKIRRYKKNSSLLNQFRSELRKFKPDKTNYGFVIPCYKNPEELDKCLEDLINKIKIPREDIIVVDDFSDDRTIEPAKKYSLRTLVLKKEEKTVRKLDALKKGVEEIIKLDKEFVITLDSDSYIKNKKDDLDYAIEEMKILGLDIMAGQLVPKADSWFFENLQLEEYKHAMRIERGSLYSIKANKLKINSKNDLKRKYMLKDADNLCVSGAFGIYKPNLLLDVLNEHKGVNCGDDVEVTIRALSKDAKIGFNEQIIVETEAPNNLKGFTKQRDLWTQFISSSYLNAPYVKDIRKNRLGKLELLFYKWRDFYLHPVKLASIPLLMSQAPEVSVPLVATLGGIYTFLNLYSVNKINENGEKRNLVTELTLPLLRFYNLIVPTTMGYYHSIKERISK